jgi:hypothetical protein
MSRVPARGRARVVCPALANERGDSERFKHPGS